MTDQEFSRWTTDLFVSFPSLNEWLMKASPDPMGTQAKWRKTLRPYTLAECLKVTEDWSAGKLKPFEGYEKDKIHLIVASTIGLKRDRASKQQELRDGNQKYIDKQRGAFDMKAVLGDSSMVAAYEELRPLHKSMKEGKISKVDYDCKEIEAMEKHGLNRRPVS